MPGTGSATLAADVVPEQNQASDKQFLLGGFKQRAFVSPLTS
jgi:hypothetical protein